MMRLACAARGAVRARAAKRGIVAKPPISATRARPKMAIGLSRAARDSARPEVNDCQPGGASPIFDRSDPSVPPAKGRPAMSFAAAIHRKAVDLGKLSVEMTTAAGSGHPSTALSLAHLTAVLLYHQMRWDPKDPWNQASDRLVLSEGHAVPTLYAAYADLGGVITPIGKWRERSA